MGLYGQQEITTSVFNADDGRIAGHNLVCVQKAPIAMVIMFERVGLKKDMSKTKSMIGTPGFIWGQQGDKAYTQRATGVGPTFWERKRTRVSCKECRGTMATYSLCYHTEKSPGIVLPHSRGIDIGGGGSETYKMLFPRI